MGKPPSTTKSPPAVSAEARQKHLGRLADFFNEVGMLKNTPRSGFAFLGSGGENVADHSHRTAIIGYALAKLAGADQARVVFMCLFHDVHEARTGDFNYVNHRYDSCRAREALEDGCRGTGMEREILGYWDELETDSGLEAHIANDADQLDLICNLQSELRKGNEFAREWLDSALKRLRLPISRDMAEEILKTDPNRWWYGQVDKDWWINHGVKK